MTSPLLDRPGAVPAQGPDEGVAWHYGDPTGEQRELAAGRAIVDQSHLGVVTVTGPDRLSWLNSLSTQDVTALSPGTSTELMILSPQGRIEHVAGLVDNGTTAWLLTETAPALAAYLDRMRFMLRVEVADATGEWAAIGRGGVAPVAPVTSDASVASDAADALAGQAHGVTWIDPWPGISAGGTTYAATPGNHPAAGRQWSLTLVPRPLHARFIDAYLAAGATLAGTWASEALRVAGHRPRAVLDVDATTLPHELDWLRTAVHLHKGCYRGQETVAKVHNVGRPPRRLTLLHLDGSTHELPAPGAAVTAGVDGPVVGHVTSPARHGELGPIALAVLKRSVDPATVLAVATDSGPVSAAQELIVNADGFSVDRPPAPGPTMKGLLMGKGCAADGGDLPD